MIIVQLSGGLGNQMFQYALYLALGAEGREVRIDETTEYGEHERLRHPELREDFGAQLPSYRIATREEIVELTDSYMDFLSRVRRKLTGRRTKLYAERKPYVFDPAVLGLTEAYLTGCWQSERYFADVKQEVRQAFSMDGVRLAGRRREYEKMILALESADARPQSEEAASGRQSGTAKCGEAERAALHCGKDGLRQDVSTEGAPRPVPVSVHIRRGDYLNRQDIYGGICTEEYYRRAMTQMEEALRKRGERPQYFVFTNDPDWAEQHFAGSGAVVVRGEGKPDGSGIEDMKLMSLCRHHIIANSSFSWWGSWLSREDGRLVMAPPRFINTSDGTDMLRDDMIIIQ